MELSGRAMVEDGKTWTRKALRTGGNVDGSSIGQLMMKRIDLEAEE